MDVKVLGTYKDWKPVYHSVIKDKNLADIIHSQGYAVVSLINQEQINELRDFYQKEHQLKIENGGMFYSLYSRDLNYRKKVHETINKLLQPTLDNYFSDYKNIVNTFITKSPGPESEFYVHQDTTALDEYKHSPLSVWIPLQDISPKNGALGVIEKTHWFFSPYRGISFNSPFQKINRTLREYLKPIYLKAGEAIIFDSRIVHHSMPNISKSDRIVVLCGIFPKNAEFTICYKEPESNKIELIKQDDSFILENESFFYDCHSRPKKGIKIKEVENDFPEMTEETFTELCKLNRIEKLNLIENEQNINCNFIAEPNGINLYQTEEKPSVSKKSVWDSLKKHFTLNNR